jgi:hypothetical protein
MTLSLLSVDREQRGTAAQWARALEQVARHVEQEGSPSRAAVPDSLPVPPAAEQPAEAPAPKAHEEAALKGAPGPLAKESSGAIGAAERFRHRARTRGGWPWLTLAAAGLALVLGVRPAPRGEPPEESALTHAGSSNEDAPGAGTRGLGEAAATALEQAPAASRHEKLAQESLPEPQPGQLRPDAKGRCPHKRQTALNKGCWLETHWIARDACRSMARCSRASATSPSSLPGARPPRAPRTSRNPGRVHC